jgi:hypothetical protein
MLLDILVASAVQLNYPITVISYTSLLSTINTHINTEAATDRADVGQGHTKILG